MSSKQEFFDQLVQLLSPFGWTVRMLDEPIFPSSVAFRLELKVTAEASRLYGQRFGRAIVFTEREFRADRIPSAQVWAERVTREVMAVIASQTQQVESVL